MRDVAAVGACAVALSLLLVHFYWRVMLDRLRS